MEAWLKLKRSANQVEPFLPIYKYQWLDCLGESQIQSGRRTLYHHKPPVTYGCVVCECLFVVHSSVLNYINPSTSMLVCCSQTNKGSGLRPRSWT